MTVAAGMTAAAAAITAGVFDPRALIAPVVPLAWPTLPLWPVLGVLVGLLPAVLTPRPPVVNAVVAAAPRSAARAA